MKKYNYNYLTTNIVTGKQYIGAHSTDRLNDRYIGSGSILSKEIKAYGRNSFKKEIITFTFDLTDAKKNECRLIAEHNTLCPTGYNKHREGGTMSVNERNSYINLKDKDINYLIDKAYELYSDYSVYSFDEYVDYKKRIIKKDIDVIKYIRKTYVETLNKVYFISLYLNY
jgi:hypothetical protein